MIYSKQQVEFCIKDDAGNILLEGIGNPATITETRDAWGGTKFDVEIKATRLIRHNVSLIQETFHTPAAIIGGVGHPSLEFQSKYEPSETEQVVMRAMESRRQNLRNQVFASIYGTPERAQADWKAYQDFVAAYPRLKTEDQRRRAFNRYYTGSRSFSKPSGWACTVHSFDLGNQW